MIWINNIKLFALILIFFSPKCSGNDYCGDTFCKGNKDHTLCKFQVSTPSENCIDRETIILSDKDRNAVLDKINLRRNKVAAGEIRSLPSAQRMLKLEWNDELALSAQRWADQCVSQDVEDSCRDLENVPVGQNIATIYGASPGLNPTVLVDLWYTELLHINSSIISNYQPSSITGLQHYDYFTQLMWDKTSQVGCGGVKFKEQSKEFVVKKKRAVYRLVCNFAPRGNKREETVYSDGSPCSNCPLGYSCDTKYKALCGKSSDTSYVKNEFKQIENFTNSFDLLKKFNNDDERLLKNPKNLTSNTSGEKPIITFESNDAADSFDLFSHLFPTTSSIQQTTQSTARCKDDIAVEEFLRLLKNKLSNEQLLREYLFSTKIGLDSSIADETVAAIVQEIYSKKVSTTTKMTTENENINSTALADLVEAVIFRKNDAFATSIESEIKTSVTPDVRPIKIHAALGEVNTNAEFTGHYFFPEDEDEKLNSDATESYYDATNLPLPDISLEIEDLKSKKTRNFLDEVLDEESMTESVTENSLFLSSVALGNSTAGFLIQLRRNKRSINHVKFGRDNRKNTNVISMNYYILLQKLAKDLKMLKFNKFSCSFNRSYSFVKKNTINNNLLISLLIFSLCTFIKLL